MPIIDKRDAKDVHQYIDRIFSANSPDARARAIRTLFAEKLDFDPLTGAMSLTGTPANVHLPEVAHRIAGLEGVQVVYVDLSEVQPDTNRIRKAEAAAAAKIVSDRISDDPLLLFTNRDASQLHFVYPDFVGTQPTLRRLVVERDLPRRTAVQQVANIYHQWQRTGSLHTALERAFDVEAVTAAFFDEYKRVFDLALERVEGFSDADEEQESKKLFVQTLFNRLMFVYFLSRKGWLTFNGETDYLNALWRDYQANPDQDNFYRDRLYHLFFFGLNNPQSRDLNFRDSVMASVYGDVPFLNGGLFQKSELDGRDGLNLPDQAIEPVLTDLFDRFNFTVMESTPFDIEVAVDPEMLGKVFEELVTGRHDSGSYYTPRPVVAFMCREALKGYLEGSDTGLTPDVIAAFVDKRETDGISPARAPSVAAALESVTVVDPACGSGAYLLGMMQELVDLRTALFNVGVDAKSLYDLKLHVIQRNLYGVDLDEFAVNIAMLRMWLSLAIEYEGETPEPLPNLDFKVVRGDSLLGPDPSAGAEVQGTLGWDVERIRELGNLKAEYMGAYTGTDKDRLRRQIESLNSEVRDALGVTETAGVVDWRVEFAEVLAARKGFDVVIANPPYVRQELIGPNKAALTKQYADAAVARSDLYCYFYARALQLLRDGGMHVFVCSNSWLDVGYGAKLQQYLLSNSRVQAIYESAVERQFSTADINTVISIIRKAGAPGNADTRFVSLRAEFETALHDPGRCREIVRDRATLLAAGRHGTRYVGDKWGGKYLRAPDIYHHILEKYADKLVRLGDVATVRRGVTTGANDFFFLTSERIAEFGIEPEYLSPVMTTPQESRSIAVDPTALPKRLFLCNKDKSDLAGTGALEYIKWGEEKEYHKRTSVRSRSLWYDVGKRNSSQLAMNYLIDTTARTFLVAEGQYFGDNFQKLRSDKVSPLQLCAAMNSTVSQLMFNVGGRANFGGGLMKIQTFEIANLLLVNPQLLTETDPSTFRSANWDVLSPSAARWQIDGMVFDALGLTAGERLAVHEGVTELVTNRKRRARSVPDGPRAVKVEETAADAVARNIVMRGQSIYDEKIRHKVEDSERGKFAVIDVYSEDYEIDARHADASRRLVDRHPGAITYPVRIGQPTAYKFGFRSRYRTS